MLKYVGTDGADVEESGLQARGRDGKLEIRAFKNNSCLLPYLLLSVRHTPNVLFSQYKLILYRPIYH